jgi:hypothetical protein
MADTNPRDLIERMCACLHGWSVLWGPAANSPTHILIDEARRYLAQSEPKSPILKEKALEVLRQLENGAIAAGERADTIRRALEQLPDNV